MTEKIPKEMLDAGANALIGAWGRDLTFEEIARRVWEAMEGARK